MSVRELIVAAIERLTLRRVRGQHYSRPFQPDLRWWWTPWTHRFGHGGWVFLSPAWFWRFRHGS